MAIELDHMVVYSRDHNKAAEAFADVMGLPIGRMSGKGYDFAIVRVNQQLDIYFSNRYGGSLEQHIAFSVDGSSFDDILKRFKEKEVPFGNSPYDASNQRSDHIFAPRGLFWYNADGCLFELMSE